MENKDARVSVIVPVFNGTYLKEALTSVLNQDYKNLEVIVVDDGSTDHTPEIIRSYGAITGIRTPNRGVSSARNTGVRASCGEYISFIDADDTWVKEKTRRQVELLRENPAAELVHSRFRNYFQPGYPLPAGINKDKFLHPDTGRMMFLGTLMMKRETFHQVGFFDESLRTGEDLDWFIRAKEKGVRILFDDYTVAGRRLHDSNLSMKNAGDKSDLFRLLHSSIRRRREEGK